MNSKISNKMKRGTLTGLIAGMGLLLFIAGCGNDDDDDNSGLSGLMGNSFNNITTYPAPEKLIYLQKDGTSIMCKVYPGQVVIMTDGASTSEVTQLVEQNSGTVSAQVPNAGLYLATIDPGIINAFLSAMYLSPLVIDAFPNRYVRGKSAFGSCGATAVTGDKNSTIQTIDLSADMGCPSNFYHKDAVAAVAGQNSTSVNINDVTVYNAETDSAGADTYKSMQKMLELLNYAKQNNLPVVINMSMGGNDYIQDDDYHYYRRFGYLLQAVEKQDPHLLDNAVIFLSGADVSRNETSDYNRLHNDFPASPIWDHLYFVGSQEGASGCGMGYADYGTANYLAAPACGILTGPDCQVSGNSFSVPQISSLVAQTYQMLQEADKQVSMPEITSKLWDYQKLHNGDLPSAATLYSLCAGDGGFDNRYDGTWSGTFYYTAEIPQQSGPPEVVNTSFILTVTLESVYYVPGQTQYLNVKAVTCSDPSFGATLAIAPVVNLSIALLPAYFGSPSTTGMGINVEFPNGSHIFTTNSIDGSFIVDENGYVLESTDAVSNEAFSAGGTVENSNEPGSGPGGYAYNWCTFKSWSLLRL
jgi:hypothetical protein